MGDTLSDTGTKFRKEEGEWMQGNVQVGPDLRQSVSKCSHVPSSHSFKICLSHSGEGPAE
jgi:hypothetical protein